MATDTPATSDYTPVAQWYDRTRNLPPELLAECFTRFAELAEFLVGDVRDLPFPDGHFDAVVVSKLFQHVPAWPDAVDELRRVTRPDGFLLHINEKRAFKNDVRQRFADECDSRGYVHRYHGLRDRTELARYVEATGGLRIDLDVTDLDWTKDVTYGQALEHLLLRLHSEFWSIPDEEYRAILDVVADWVAAQPAGEQTTQTMYPFLTAEVFRWSAA